jgi:UDP-N-acetylmuramate--alanine ligase
VGGRVTGWGGNLLFGSGDLFVVEADEYDRSFHTLTPDVAVVTNVESDHLDVYGDLDGVRDGFRTFLEGARSGGRVAACADDHGAASLLSGVRSSAYSYGLSAGSRLRAVDVRFEGDATVCRVIEDGLDRGSLSVPMPGTHNLRNALAAACAARALGVAWDEVGGALAEFRGVQRRFERLGSARGVTVVDDYAHHPTEIRATLGAARASFPESRLVVVFQPHLYSRTRDFHEDFGRSLHKADEVWVTEVFPAREAPIPGVSGSLIAEAARRAGAPSVHFHPIMEDLPAKLAGGLRRGDVLLTLGAGSVERVGREVLRELEADNHA